MIDLTGNSGEAMKPSKQKMLEINLHSQLSIIGETPQNATFRTTD